MKQTLILFLALFPAAAVAPAQPFDIAYVSVSGFDDFLCGDRTHPCRTFDSAMANINPGGTLKALDAVVSIGIFPARSLTIDGSGVATVYPVGTSTAVDTTGVTIPPGTKVVIRDLTIIAVPGFDGIHTNVAMYLENVVIVGQPRFGINVTGGSLTTKNVTVSGATSAGIQVTNSSTAYLRDAVVRGSGVGVYAFGSAAIQIERCELSFNTTGLLVDASTGGPATVRISDSVITGNGIGIQATGGGQIISFRNNMLAGNTTDGATPFSVSVK